MIKKTRLKIVFVVELLIASTFLIIFLSIVITSYAKEINRTNDILNKITKDVIGGHPKPAQSRSFYLKINEDITIIDYDQRFFNEDEVKKYIDEIQTFDKQKGEYKNIYYRIITNNDVTIIVGIDIGLEKNMLFENIVYLLSFGGLGLLVLGFIMWFLSSIIMRPLKRNIESQKVFISDASHELKTPITSIMINLDVLEDEYDKNKWTENIKNQIQRLSILSDELLALSKLDEENKKELVRLNLSKLLEEEVSSLEVIAYENNKDLDVIIEDDIYVFANEIELIKLLNIFFDNAVKHSNESAKILLRLTNQTKPQLIIYNTTNNISIN